MKTVMFKMTLSNGTEMAVIREDNTYKVQANGITFFSHPNYERAREVLIA